MSVESDKGFLAGLPPLSELLPIGYLYLLILGIASQSIFYGFQGINYLAYSDVLDVLISPIAVLTGNLLLFIVMSAIVVLSYPYLLVIRKIAVRKKPEALTKGLLAQPLAVAWLQVAGATLLFAYLGMGFGAGMAVQERLSQADPRLDHRIVFSDGVVEDVELIGKNASYLFFVRLGESTVTVAPVSDNVRTITRITDL